MNLLICLFTFCTVIRFWTFASLLQVGLFDLEVNCLTKILFGALVVVSLVMVALQHFAGHWYLQIFRFLLLFSHIVPIRSDFKNLS